MHLYWKVMTMEGGGGNNFDNQVLGMALDTGFLLSFDPSWGWIKYFILLTNIIPLRSKSEREKQIPYANTYIWNLKKKKKGYEAPGAGEE